MNKCSRVNKYPQHNPTSGELDVAFKQWEKMTVRILTNNIVTFCHHNSSSHSEPMGERFYSVLGSDEMFPTSQCRDRRQLQEKLTTSPQNLNMSNIDGVSEEMKR